MFQTCWRKQMVGIFRRKGPIDDEIFLQAIEEAEREFQKRRVPDLLISVSADATSQAHYLISVTNTGARTFEDLRVKYEAFLLDAESFGLDTTHMPSELARRPGEPLLIRTLVPGQTVQEVRKGYGAQEDYDGFSEYRVELEYRAEGRTFVQHDRQWANVVVNLPNARKA